MEWGRGQGESRIASGQLDTPNVGAERLSPFRYPLLALRTTLDTLLISGRRTQRALMVDMRT